MASKTQIQHIGIIMDGNRRWAKNSGLPQLEGHRRGYAKLKQVSDWCINSGIRYLTVYAFSTENWNRSKEEVEYLMNLFREMFKRDGDQFNKKDIKVVVIGQRERLDADIQDMVGEVETKTANNSALTLQIAISYGGRTELLEAIKNIIKSGATEQEITEDLIEKNLWTAGVPDPDLIIRTSGEQRLSNFLTWQSAYSELLFVEKHWPAFEREDFMAAIEEFNRRARRYGK